jgi:hypothetical protein
MAGSPDVLEPEINPFHGIHKGPETGAGWWRTGWKSCGEIPLQFRCSAKYFGC